MNKKTKLTLLITFGVLGLIIGLLLQRPALLLIPAFLLGAAYKIYNEK